MIAVVNSQQNINKCHRLVVDGAEGMQVIAHSYNGHTRKLTIVLVESRIADRRPRKLVCPDVGLRSWRPSKPDCELHAPAGFYYDKMCVAVRRAF